MPTGIKTTSRPSASTAIERARREASDPPSPEHREAETRDRIIWLVSQNDKAPSACLSYCPARTPGDPRAVSFRPRPCRAAASPKTFLTFSPQSDQSHHSGDTPHPGGAWLEGDTAPPPQGHDLPDSETETEAFSRAPEPAWSAPPLAPVPPGAPSPGRPASGAHSALRPGVSPSPVAVMSVIVTTKDPHGAAAPPGAEAASDGKTGALAAADGTAPPVATVSSWRAKVLNKVGHHCRIRGEGEGDANDTCVGLLFLVVSPRSPTWSIPLEASPRPLPLPILPFPSC